MKSKIKSIKLQKKILPSSKHPLQYNFQEQEQSTVPLKPFYRKFTKAKTEGPDSSYVIEPCLDSRVTEGGTGNQVVTETQTNDHYESDFEYSVDESEFNETVLEQNQNAEESNNQIYQTEKHLKIEESNTDTNPYDYYSCWQLLKMNQNLIKYVQFFRQNLNRLRVNSTKLVKQEHELTYLRQRCRKAVDYKYELQLDKKSMSGSQQQHISISKAREISMILHKHKYQRIKEAFRKAHPTMFEMQRDTMQQNKNFDKLIAMKQQLFIKKKQYYGYKQKSSLLDQKIKQYASMLDSFDSYLSRGDKQTLEERKMYLEQQISLKRTINTICQAEINAHITHFNNQIMQPEATIMKVTREKRQTEKEISKLTKKEACQDQTEKAHRKLTKIKHSPPKTTVKRSKYGSNAASTPKVINKYFYNSNSRRNSYFHA